ncbi:hypothetical protein BDB01DRAFT_797849 [Pilobolus umbonatus]|nr:hypothetical protein BDB01DRAFT_797849 [Pilobolus umbonatus]
MTFFVLLIVVPKSFLIEVEYSPTLSPLKHSLIKSTFYLIVECYTYHFNMIFGTSRKYDSKIGAQSLFTKSPSVNCFVLLSQDRKEGEY